MVTTRSRAHLASTTPTTSAGTNAQSAPKQEPIAKKAKRSPAKKSPVKKSSVKKSPVKKSSGKEPAAKSAPTKKARRRAAAPLPDDSSRWLRRRPSMRRGPRNPEATPDDLGSDFEDEAERERYTARAGEVRGEVSPSMRARRPAATRQNSVTGEASRPGSRGAVAPSTPPNRPAPSSKSDSDSNGDSDGDSDAFFKVTKPTAPKTSPFGPPLRSSTSSRHESYSTAQDSRSPVGARPAGLGPPTIWGPREQPVVRLPATTYHAPTVESDHEGSDDVECLGSTNAPRDVSQYLQDHPGVDGVSAILQRAARAAVARVAPANATTQPHRRRSSGSAARPPPARTAPQTPTRRSASGVRRPRPRPSTSPITPSTNLLSTIATAGGSPAPSRHGSLARGTPSPGARSPSGRYIQSPLTPRRFQRELQQLQARLVTDQGAVNWLRRERERQRVSRAEEAEDLDEWVRLMWGEEEGAPEI